MAAKSDLEDTDELMDTSPNVDSQLPTPPAEIPGSLPFEESPNFASDSAPGAWPPSEWNTTPSNARSSPASSSGVSDDAEPPPFDHSADDFLLQSNWNPADSMDLKVFDFPDPTSHGSPSSVNAEFDQEDLDTDLSEDSGNRYQFSSPAVDDEMPDLESSGTSSQTTQAPITVVGPDHGPSTPPVETISNDGTHTNMDI